MKDDMKPPKKTISEMEEDYFRCMEIVQSIAKKYVYGHYPDGFYGRHNEAGEQKYYSVKELYKEAVSCGCEGYMMAKRRYNEEEGPFKNYAYWFIKGNIISGLKKFLELPQLPRDRRILEHIKETLEYKLKRSPTIDECAAAYAEHYDSELDGDNYQINYEEGRKKFEKLSMAYTLTEKTSEPISDGSPPTKNHLKNPDKKLLEKERDAIVRSCIEKLSKIKKMVVILKYYDGLKQIEIGVILNKHKTRIAQILSEVKEPLRRCLENRGVS